MAEQGQDEGQLLQSAKKLPWDVRIAHKNWKIRNDAYLDLAQACKDISDPKDAKLKEYGPLFVKAVADSNANAQEKALDALIEFLKAADADAARFGKGVCSAIVAKCLTGRTKTLEKSQQAFMLWVELEAVEPFMDSMDVAIKSKVNKAVVPAVDAMFQALSEFGVKVIPPKRLLKVLGELLEHADDKIRNSAKGLAVELCKWIGKPAVQASLFDKLRDTVKKDIEEEYERQKGERVKVTRYIRSEQEKVHAEEEVAVPGGAKADQGEEENASTEVDAWELMDPVDILSKLDKEWGENVLKIQKWSERKDKVAELTNLAKATRLAKGDYQDVSRALKKLIGDINVAVVVEAVTAAGNLARGLRSDYGAGSRFLVAPLLEKFKEKKKNVVEALHMTLETMHAGGCISLADPLEDVKTALQNKVPSVRSETLKWLGKCFERSKKADVLKVHKDYIPLLVEKGLGDGTVEVRDAAFDVLAAIGKKAGIRPLERALEKLDDVKKKKLTDMINDATNAAAAAPTANGAGGASVSAASSVATEVGSAEVKRVSASTAMGKRPAAKPAPGKKAAGGAGPASKKAESGAVGGKGAPGGASAVDDEKVPDMSKEEVEALVTPLLPENALEGIRSEKWQERSEALQKLKQTVEEMVPASLTSSAEPLIRLLSFLPGFSEKNQQVLKIAFEIISDIAKRANPLPRRCVMICLPGLAEKIADIKLKLAVAECLTVFAEAVGPNFVIDKLSKIAKEHKNPKVLSESFLWMAKAVEDFGTGNVKLKDLIDYSKDTGLTSSQPAVRTGAAKLLGALHKWVGPDLKQFLSDIKPALMTMVETELARNPYEGPGAVAKIAVRGGGGGTEGGGGGGGAGEGGLPREDISKRLTDEFLEKLNSSDWKVRQETLQEINKILDEANRRILPNGTGEMFNALKGRLGDSNKNLVVLTLDILGNITAAMGPAIDKHSRGVLTDILKSLSDKSSQSRAAVLKCLDSWVAVLPPEKLVPYLTVALQDPKLSAEGRKDLFTWAAKQIGKAKERAELMPMLNAVTAGLQDKGADVRKGAEEFLLELGKSCGCDMVVKASKGLKGAALLNPILDRLRPAGGEADPGGDTRGSEQAEASSSSSSSTSRPASAAMKRSSSRPGTAAKAGTAASRQKEADAQRDKDMQGQPLVRADLVAKNKVERERNYPRKSKFEEPREDQAKELEEEFGRTLRDDLRVRMFSSDFKKQVEALDIIQRALPGQIDELIDILDYFLRWSVLRLCESNTTILLKVLEVFPALIQALTQRNYMLTEWEAQFFIPCLVEKSGHNIEKVREKMRDVMQGLTSVCPISRMMPYVVEGTRSKNNRTKIECVDQIDRFVERHGVEIVGSTRALQVVAGLTAEKDAELRRVTLNALATAYKILGDDIWRHVGKLAEAQKGLIDDKFKWTVREMEKRREGRPGESGSAGHHGLRENGGEATEQSGDSALRSSTTSITSRHAGAPVDVSQQHVSESPARWQGPLPGSWEEGLHFIEHAPTLEQSVEGMKLICRDIGDLAKAQDPMLLETCCRDADHLVAILAAKLPVTFNVVLGSGMSRPCKYVLNTLMQLYQSKSMAHSVSDAVMRVLVSELLLWLLDDQVTASSDGPTLIKALNVLMLKILENAERTAGITVLISLLRPIDPSKGTSPTPRMTHEEALSTKGAKFSDLVVKCLIKQTKALHITIDEVDLDRLLESIYLYLEELGMDEIRRRAGADDKPLRMVKTVLHELVKVRGPAIKGHLSRVPIDADPLPIILAYIDLNLQTLAASGQLPVMSASAAAPSATRTSPSADVSNSGTAGGLWDFQTKQLTGIFKKIGDKQTSAAGLTDLYYFVQAHPQHDIFSHLQNASEPFRAYIRDGLEQVERNVTSSRGPAAGHSSQHPQLPGTDPGPASVSATGASMNGLGSAGSGHGGGAAAPAVRPGSGGEAEGRNGVPAPQAPDIGAAQGIESLRDRLRNIKAAVSSASSALPAGGAVPPSSHSAAAASGEVASVDATHK